MAVSGVGNRNALIVQSLVNMRRQLDDLQRQLSTGKKSDSYAGVGLQRGLAVGLRTHMSAIDSFDDAITNIGVRLNSAQTALTQIDKSIHSVKTSTYTSVFTIDQSGQTLDQKSAGGMLDQIFGILNTRVGDRYIFSGASPDKQTAAATDVILNGFGAQAGFKQIMAERKAADLGTNGLGRLTLPALVSTPATLTGTGATLVTDAPATVQGSVDLSAFIGGGESFDINGTPVTIPNATPIGGVIASLNAQTTPLGISTTLDPSNQIVFTSLDDDATINLTNPSPAGIFGTLGITGGLHTPTNLLSQGITTGQQLTVTIGSNPTLTITFGTNEGAVPPEVSTIAELNARLGTLTGGTANVGVGGNMTITAGNTSDAIVVGGNANTALFGLAATTAAPANTTALTEDSVAAHPFGFKLAGVSSTLTGATVAGPTGSPPGISVDLGATNPNAGESIKYAFTLPDGSQEELTLTATTTSPPLEGQFTIGATSDVTATNLRAALNTAVAKLADTSLAAASAIAASNDFFNVSDANPPRRVGTTPFGTATTLVAGTSTNTVTWYTGEAGSTSARSTAVARVDNAITISYGMRANEQAVSSGIANIAVFAAMSFSASDTNAATRYEELKQRLGPRLDVPQGQQRLTDIQSEVAGAQIAMAAAKDRHVQTQATIETLLHHVEGVSTEEVAATILTLQTRLQASLQTTSMLMRTSLVDYL